MTKPVDLGLPTNDLSGYRIAFNPATSTLAVQVWVSRDDVDLGEVYARAPGSQTYRRIAASDEPNISDECPVAADGAPYLFFIRKLARKHEGGWGFTVRAIVRVDLETGGCDECMIPRSTPAEWWPADLLSASSDGRVLIARTGSVLRTPLGEGKGSYAVSRLDLVSETITPLAPLPAIFA